MVVKERPCFLTKSCAIRGGNQAVAELEREKTSGRNHPEGEYFFLSFKEGGHG